MAVAVVFLPAVRSLTILNNVPAKNMMLPVPLVLLEMVSFLADQPMIAASSSVRLPLVVF